MPEYNVPEREHAALLTVDLQRDFAMGESPVKSSGVGPRTPRIKDLVEGFRAAGKPVLHGVRLYRPDGSNVDLCRRAAVEEGLRVLMPGTRGAELWDCIKPSANVRLDAEALMAGEVQEIAANEYVFYKPRWGAFYGSALDGLLQRLGVTTLAICGCNFPTGGRATVYEASARDYRVTVASDAVCDASEEALLELGRLGVYQMDTAACLAWLKGQRAATAA
jgi:nicotinamidase-related amidase